MPIWLASFGKSILGKWKLYAAVFGLVVLVCGLSYCQGRRDGREAEQVAQAKAALKDAENARKADEKADTQRQDDTERNAADEKSRNDAIERGGRIELNCQRLRNAGVSEADLPAPCGRGGGN